MSIYEEPFVDSDECPTLLEEREADEKKLSSILAQESEDSVHTKLENLTQRYNELVEENEKAPDGEKLSIDDFIIDFEYKKQLEEEGEKEVENVKKNILKNNLRKELLRKRIKEECWDTMLNHSITLKGFHTDVEVTNYILRKPNEKLEKLRKKVKFLRKIEELELQKRRPFTITYGLEGGVAEEHHDEETDAESEKSARSSQKNDTSQLSAFDEIEDIDSGDFRVLKTDEELLYSAYDLYTRQRKVSQIYILQDIIQKHRIDFNKKFDEVFAKKETCINKIKQINEKIAEILDELKTKVQDVNLVEPALQPCECPETLLEVKPDEIDVERYISPEERKRLEEERRLQEERLAKERGAGAIERALNMMMDGRLEQPEGEAEEVIEAPACINKPEKELTQHERDLIKEYKDRLRQKEEEEMKRQKQLEARLKQAKQEVLDICNKFDESLIELHNHKMKVEEMILIEELRVIKLAQSILAQEEADIEEQEMTKHLDNLKQQKAASSSAVQELAKEVELARQEYETKVQEDKQLDRTFKSKFTDSQDVVDKLYRMFRNRPKYRPLNEAEIAANAEYQIDPFADIDIRESVKSAPVHDPLNKLKDKPADVSESTWEIFWDLRQKKINSDREVRLAASKLNKLTRQLEELKKEDKKLDEIMSENMTKLTTFKNRKIEQMFNLDIMFKFMQGQIELDQEVVVTDFADAILIPKVNILELNRAVKYHGSEKVKQMEKSRDLQKEINRAEWLNELTAFEAEDMHIKHRRLQRLKVTKYMQELIKGDGKDRTERERLRLQKQIELTKTNLAQKIAERKATIKRIQKTIKETQQQNLQYAKEVAQVTTTVNERKHIVKLQSLTKDKARMDKKMQELRLERKLKNTVKEQQQELQYLRAEIEKLRERTFPSFAVVEKRKIGQKYDSTRSM